MYSSGISSSASLLTLVPSLMSNIITVAGIGMIISAQWELVLGNSFGYTCLSAFGKIQSHSVKLQSLIVSQVSSTVALAPSSHPFSA